MVLFLKIKYPKFLGLLITIIFAYLIFSHEFIISPLIDLLLSLQFLGIFFTGMFYAYSFTAAPATAVLLILSQEHNILITALLGGMGAVIADLTIFKFIRHSFEDELKMFSEERYFIYIKEKTHPFIQKYFMIFAGLFAVASPLPDEVGVFILASYTNMSTRMFSVLSFLLNTSGILVILIIGNSI